MPTLFYIGWVATVILLCAHLSWPGVIAIALFAAATISLYLQPDVPFRDKALGISWVGPMIVVIGALVEWHWFPPDRQIDPKDLVGGVNSIIFQGLADAATMATWGLWFIRWYGMVTFLYLVSLFVRKQSRLRFFRGGYTYPLRWWWLLPPILAAKGLTVAGFVYFKIRPDMLGTEYTRTTVVSPDGRTIATGGFKSDDMTFTNTIRLYSATDMKLKDTIFDNDADSTSRLLFSPDGTLLAASVTRGPRGSKKHGIEIWDWRTKKRLQYIVAPSVYAVSFSPDDKRIAAGAGKNAVGIWDVASGTLLLTVKDNSGCAIAVALSPDGNSVASGGCNAGVTLTDIATGRHTFNLKEIVGKTYCVGFSPNSKTLVSGGKDKLLRAWDTSTGKLLRTLNGPRGPIRATAFSPDGSLLAAGSADDRISVWNTANWTMRITLPDYHGTSQISFTPDGRSIVGIGNDDKLKVWVVGAR